MNSSKNIKNKVAEMTDVYCKARERWEGNPEATFHHLKQMLYATKVINGIVLGDLTDIVGRAEEKQQNQDIQCAGKNQNYEDLDAIEIDQTDLEEAENGGDNDAVYEISDSETETVTAQKFVHTALVHANPIGPDEVVANKEEPSWFLTVRLRKNDPIFGHSASATATRSSNATQTQAREGTQSLFSLQRSVKFCDSASDSFRSEPSTSAAATGTTKHSEPSTSAVGFKIPKLKRAAPPNQTTPVKQLLKKRRGTESASTKLANDLWQPLASKKTDSTKRQPPKSRNTVTIPNVQLSDDSDEKERDANDIKNTNYAVHCGANSMYMKLCLLCNKNDRHMVQHFIKMHPDREVFVSRLSPEMMARLKKQKMPEFARDGNKIRGICFFCAEEKSFTITSWERHLLTHTGEAKFFCSDCLHEEDKLTQHGKCGSSSTNIFDNKNSLDCYACNLCHFIQINEIKMIAHLRLEHELQENNNYTKFVLVPKLKK